MLTKEAIVEHYPNGQLEWRIPIEWHVVGAYRFHGEAVSYYPTGEIKIRKVYEHGLLVGDEVMYYRDGSVMSILPFKAGRKEGVYSFRHPDGSQEECEYKDGEPVDGSIRKLDQQGKEKKGNAAKREPNLEPKKILPGDHIPASLA